MMVLIPLCCVERPAFRAAKIVIFLKQTTTVEEFFQQMLVGNKIIRTFAAAFDAMNHAEVAESVDASVSKTDEVTLVPVRSRPSVPRKKQPRLFEAAFVFLFFKPKRGGSRYLCAVFPSPPHGQPNVSHDRYD